MTRGEDGDASTSMTRDEDDDSESSNERLGERFTRALRLGSARLKYHPAVRRLGRALAASTVEDMSSSSSALVLLGVVYYNDDDDVGDKGCGADDAGKSSAWIEARAAFHADFLSRLWMSYRRNFASCLRGTTWKSDAGWGCTIRSAQMMLANAFSVHTRGRDWRRELEIQEPDAADDGERNVAGRGDGDVSTTRRRKIANLVDIFRRQGSEIIATKRGSDSQVDIVRWFADDDASAPYGIHRVCETTTRWGMPAGRWFEPSVMCRAFEILISQHEKMRDEIIAHVVMPTTEGEDAGGVPRVRRRDLFAKSADVGKALILFVPLVLGAGSTINTRYLNQLRAMLAFPQSLGILSGRPGSSLYVVGCASEDVFVHLDPHTVQDSTNADVDSYYCPHVAYTRGDALDPTLALGFYCRNARELDSLLDACARLAREHATIPILDVDVEDDDRDVGVVSHAHSISHDSHQAIVDDEFSDWEFI